MNSHREKIYLAALLHDIGKFYQRADVGSVANSKYLNQRNKVESTFLPQRNGFYSHKHCLWTAQFIDYNISVFKTLLNDDNAATYLTDQDNFYNLAARHHLSADQLSDLGKIIVNGPGQKAFASLTALSGTYSTKSYISSNFEI